MPGASCHQKSPSFKAGVGAHEYVVPKSMPVDQHSMPVSHSQKQSQVLAASLSQLPLATKVNKVTAGRRTDCRRLLCHLCPALSYRLYCF